MRLRSMRERLNVSVTLSRDSNFCMASRISVRRVLNCETTRLKIGSIFESRALSPFLEEAMARKQKMKPLADDEIPPIVALGRQIAETDEGREALERLKNAGSIS